MRTVTVDRTVVFPPATGGRTPSAAHGLPHRLAPSGLLGGRIKCAFGHAGARPYAFQTNDVYQPRPRRHSRIASAISKRRVRAVKFATPRFNALLVARCNTPAAACLHAVAQRPSTSFGATSSGFCVTKYTPHPLWSGSTLQPARPCRISALGAPSNRQMRLVKEENEFGFVGVAPPLAILSKSSDKSHNRQGPHKAAGWRMSRSACRNADNPAPVSRGVRIQVRQSPAPGSEKKFAAP